MWHWHLSSLRARPTPKAKSYMMGARRLHTTTSSIGTYEEEFHGGLAAPRPTCRSYDSRKTACPISTFGGIGRGPYQEDHAGALARCGSSGELLDVPTVASVEWYFCFQMWLSIHSAPVIGLYAFPRFMSIDNNSGANSHAPCVMVVSQPLRSLGRHWRASACLCV
jgi:hypothetical protein